jgi:NTE family protein
MTAMEVALPPSEPKVADAVFEGGGVKGVGLVGALAYFEEQGYQWKNVAGTSAGAITAALVAAGYAAAEIKVELDRLMTQPDAHGRKGYERFKDRSFLDRMPLVGPALSVAVEKGVYEGEYFESWMRSLLEAKGKRTLADLINPEHRESEKNSPYRYRLRVIASDITCRRMLVLPQDIIGYEEFQGDPDRVDIARAVRMSMSIPYFFEPVVLTGNDACFPRTQQEREIEETQGMCSHFTEKQRRCYIVDGGILSNFPVNLFDAPATRSPRWPTFGFKLVAPNDDRPNRIYGPMSMFSALFTTMMEAHDQRYMDEGTAVRTIKIRTEKVKTTDFDLSPDESEALYQRGRKAAVQFSQQWQGLGGFAGYVQKYRAILAPTHGNAW